MAKKKKGSLANPARLAPLDAADRDIVQVVIETPKGSRNKYSFDAEQKSSNSPKSYPLAWPFPTTSASSRPRSQKTAIPRMSSC